MWTHFKNISNFQCFSLPKIPSEGRGLNQMPFTTLLLNFEGDSLNSQKFQLSIVSADKHLSHWATKNQSIQTKYFHFPNSSGATKCLNFSSKNNLLRAWGHESIILRRQLHIILFGQNNFCFNWNDEGISLNSTLSTRTTGNYR